MFHLRRGVGLGERDRDLSARSLPGSPEGSAMTTAVDLVFIGRKRICGCTVWIGQSASGARFLREHDRTVRVQLVPAEQAPQIGFCRHNTGRALYPEKQSKQ